MNETYNAKVSQDRERNFKEKSKIEKELKIMTKRAEKAELELIKAESVKSVQSGPGETLLQDVFGNLKEFIDGQLQCSICNEIFVYSSGKLIRNSYTNSFLKTFTDPDVFCGMDHQNSNFSLIPDTFLLEAVEARRCYFFQN